MRIIGAVFYVSAWLSDGQDGSTLERAVPLLFNASRLRRIRSCQEFTVLFLEGFERLPRSYVRDLASHGFDVVDVSADLRRATAAHPELQRFGVYEQRCFLRWLILDQVATSGDQMIHIDGDIVFGATPERIAESIAGRTLVLQGCPALTAIHDRDWLAVYTEELTRFSRDIAGYSEAAWAERDGWELSHRERWAGSRFRRLISSDQDLISHLIHTRRLPQADPHDFVGSSGLYWAENPLYLHSHAELQLGRSSDVTFASSEGRCYLDSREIAVWHFQSAFVRYVARTLALRRMRWRGRVPNDIESPRLARALPPGRRRRWWLDRLSVYESLRELNDDRGELSFSDVFNAHTYWMPGFFANDQGLDRRRPKVSEILSGDRRS